MDIDWSKLITVNENWAVENLTQHTYKEEKKLILRTHSLKYVSNEYNTKTFVIRLKDYITEYVLDKKALASIKKTGEDPITSALSFFGKVNPTNDGKYGELILYLLIESILKVPMIAFKITSSPNDQVKGADGIFLGNYNGMASILIGEAKIWGSVGKGITSAFESLNRFHGTDGDDVLKYEYTVANASSRTLKNGLTEEELDYIADCLTFNSSENKQRTIVHPVLIIFNEKKIKSLIHTTNDEAETALKEVISKTIQKNFKKIKGRFKNFTKISEMHLDFFFIPVHNVEEFRNDIFTSFHGISWKEYNRQNKAKSKS